MVQLIQTFGVIQYQTKVFITLVQTVWILILLQKMKKKRNYPQVYLEEFKYEKKKKEMSAFINTEIVSDDSGFD